MLQCTSAENCETSAGPFISGIEIERMPAKCFSPELAKSAGLSQDRFPQDKDEADAAEAAMLDALGKLSLDEHEKIIFDIHGLAPEEEEDQKMVEEKLKELEEEINRITYKPAYEKALKMNPSYVTSSEFRLMFLRTEKFDTKVTADLVVAHFDAKRELFGEGEVLGRALLFSDLTETAQMILSAGFMQQFRSRDAAGRAILGFRPPTNDSGAFDMQNMVMDDMSRAMWYFQLAILKDEETQKKGVVVVLYNYHNYKEDIAFVKKMKSCGHGIPQRTIGFHYCYKDEALRPLVAGVQLFMDDNSRFRMRPHLGPPQQVDFELQTYGIPTEDSPMGKDEIWNTEAHQEWIAMHRAREEKDSPCNDSTIVPGRFDVLFGKARTAREHTGNMRLLHLCSMHWGSYETANKYGKTEIAERLVSVIHESRGRFLKEEDCGWVEVDDQVARAKISHFFRHMRSKTTKPGVTEEARKIPKRVSPSPPPSIVS